MKHPMGHERAVGDWSTRPSETRRGVPRRCIMACVGLVLALGLLAYSQWSAEACCTTEPGLVANIGHSLSSIGPWSIADTRTISHTQTVYFCALDANNQPITNYDDWDCVEGASKKDTARYGWDWYSGTGIDTYGLSKQSTYVSAGDRVVSLTASDVDGGGYTDDGDVTDTVKIKVLLTMEWDCMSGYDITETNLTNRWAGADYTLDINISHDTNCTYHQYIRDDLTAAQLTDYLDGYENQSPACDLYMIGVDHWSNQPGQNDIIGYCWEAKYSVICRGMGAGLMVELHECACHDDTIVYGSGGLGHCSTEHACACKSPGTADTFCDCNNHANDCVDRLKDEIKKYS